jgi:4-hydroxythreonine-4-phosphate dehydrogenase
MCPVVPIHPAAVRVAISTGDPRGIGPQITADALLAAQSWGALAPVPLVFGPLDHRPELTEAQAGEVSFGAVMAGIEAIKAGRADALVTAPISKSAWHAAGHTHFPGHTELLADAFASPRSGMLFVGPRLRVMLATIHVPLERVPALLTTRRVLEAIELTHESCAALGLPLARIALAGLNPHAGEGGLLGTQDDRTIAPAVALARSKGIDATGPLSGDTLFAQAVIGSPAQRFDAVVAMYHDQGLIPVKLLDGLQTVNVTVGLRWNDNPVIRTSPAHGTALDVAGTSRADAAGMVQALRLAVAMAQARPA